MNEPEKYYCKRHRDLSSVGAIALGEEIPLVKALRGSSGVLHSFAEVSDGPKGTRVVDSCSAEACETDVMRLQIKALDVGAGSAELVAPSFTHDAAELAREYGIELRSSTRHSRMK